MQTSAGQRERLLTATDRLNKTSDRIQQGRQQLLETEVGTATWVLGAEASCAVQDYRVQSTFAFPSAESFASDHTSCGVCHA